VWHAREKLAAAVSTAVAVQDPRGGMFDLVPTEPFETPSLSASCLLMHCLPHPIAHRACSADIGSRPPAALYKERGRRGYTE